MGRTVDFAKRRIAGYLVFWIVVLFLVYVLMQGETINQASALFILLFAFVVSVLYTRRMKRKQREARLARAR